MIGMSKGAKVVQHRLIKTVFRTCAGNKDWVLVIECVGTNGTTIPLYIIFKGKQQMALW